MKKIRLLLGFLPLVVYGVLAGISVSSVIVALAAATAVTLIIGWADLRKRMILPWVNLALFGSIFVAVGILGMTGIIPYMGVLIYATLTTVTSVSLLAGKPFTLQYAREMVDKALWENPGFIRVNILITSVWDGVFLLNLGLTAIALLNPGFIGRIALLLTCAVIMAGIIFTLWYPDYVRKKYTIAKSPHAG